MIPEQRSTLANHLWQSTRFANIAGLASRECFKSASPVSGAKRRVPRHDVQQCREQDSHFLNFRLPQLLLGLNRKRGRWEPTYGVDPASLSSNLSRKSLPGIGTKGKKE